MQRIIGENCFECFGNKGETNRMTFQVKCGDIIIIIILLLLLLYTRSEN